METDKTIQGGCRERWGATFEDEKQDKMIDMKAGCDSVWRVKGWDKSKEKEVAERDIEDNVKKIRKQERE